MLCGLTRAADARYLVHQLLVDVEPPGSVDDEHVAALGARPLHPVLGDVDRVGVGALVVYGHAELVTQSLDLIDGCRAIDVAGDHGRALALRKQELRQLAAGGGLARALETHHHDHRGRARREGQLGGSRPHDGGQLFIDDLDELLDRGEALQDLRPQCPLLHPVDELLDHLVVDVGFEQGETYLAGRPLDVLLCELALALQAVQGTLQFVRKGFEHVSPCHR